MQDSKVIPLNRVYRYSIYVNQKAIVEFLQSEGFEPSIFKATHTLLLSFIINSFIDLKKHHCFDYDGNSYLKLTGNFVHSNMPLLGVGKSQLKNLIKHLKNHNAISTINHEKLRYVRVNPKLLKTWNSSNWNMTAIAYLNKHRPSLWERFRNEWHPIVGNHSFEQFVLWFNDEVNIKNIAYNDYERIYDFLINSIRRWKIV